MNSQQALFVSALTAPSDADWSVTLVLRPYRVCRYRIAPGDQHDQESALRSVLFQNRIPLADVVDATVVRVKDKGIVTESVEDEFKRLLAKVRCNG